jgi:hypothetical protein
VLGWKWSRAGREKREGWREKGNLFKFSKTTQTNEFKQRFEFKHSKQCTSMYATGNSYISLINLGKNDLNAYKNTISLYSLSENALLLSNF